jgi:mono/diheme cytochrome c family protein
MDDTGRLIYHTAGNEVPAHDFQFMPRYGKLNLPGQTADDFMEVFPILPTTDMQGGMRRVKQGGGLSHFTGCAGGSIYRGDALPRDLYGNYILPEPVGRLIRRAKVENIDGKVVISNYYHGQEFIASMDANFRPVWSATGPDGCLYFCDMYHGIIQESHWTMEDSYLRPQVLKYGLQKNINAGRIWRLVYDDTPRRSTPHMLEETPAQLVQHLSDPNGWWRDTAQKLLVIRNDKSVVPELRSMAENDSNPITRLHALWTLEGLDSADTALVIEKIKDADPRLRCAAIQLAEPLIAKNDSQVMAAVKPLGMDTDPSVAEQLCVSLIYTKNAQGKQLIQDFLAARQRAQLSVATPKLVVKTYEDRLAREAEETAKQKDLEKRDARLATIVAEGRQNYTLTCIACHGPDGKGTPSPDKHGTLAPPLVGSKRLMGSPELVGRIVLRGLVGPHDEGRTYPNEMASFVWADDAWLASILTYARQEWGNSAPQVTPQQLAKVRKETADRKKPFTVPELNAMHIPEPHYATAKSATTKPATTQLTQPGTTKTSAARPSP